MALSAPQVRVGITGELYSAPQGSTAPTDSTTALDAAYTGHGYISDDGVTENWDDSVDNITAWQNATTVRSARTETTASLELTLIQSNNSVLEIFYPGSEVTGTDPDFVLEVVPTVADPRQWVLDVVDGPITYRYSILNGEITERGEVMHSNGEPIGYPITIQFYPDENGLLMTKFSNDSAWAPPGP